MTSVAVGAGASGLQFAEATARIVRANGDVEDVVLSRVESEAHKAAREAQGLELPAPTFSSPIPPKQSAFARLIKWVGLGAFALAVSHYAPDYGPAIAATVITNAGQAINANLVSGLGGTVPGYVAWGTGAGTTAVTDTTLFTESTEEARTNGTKSRVTTTVTNDTYQLVGTITVVTSNKTITNVGIFDASTSGNLFFKSDFTGLALLIGDSITFTLKNKYA
jgi:hypothetical protein